MQFFNLVRFALAAAAALPLALFAQPTGKLDNLGYYRFAAPGPLHVVFTAEGDLWRAPLAGGAATRLTTHLGQETRAAISPDGQWVAYSGSSEGPVEVHVMPLNGGETKKLTHEGEQALVLGWTPAGDILYSTARHSGLPARQLATINPKTGKRSVLPIAKASEGSVDADGTVYFTRYGLRGDNARRYKGGGMLQIWRMNLAGGEATALTSEAQGNNGTPMVWRGAVYFVSDRSGARNLWRMAPDGTGARQLTQLKPTDFDLRQASLHSGKISYTVGADVRVLDTATNQDRALALTLTSDFEQKRERWVSNALRHMTSVALSPSGERVAVTARGKVLVAGTGEVRRVELATPAQSRARSAVFSSDSNKVLMFSDASGEMELVQLNASGTPGTDTTAITSDGSTVRLGLFPSPDGKWALHTDHASRLWLSELASKKTELIDTGPDLQTGVVWAPDSSAFTFARSIANRQGNDALHIVRLSDRKVFLLSTNRYQASSPAFTPDGKWLFFLSNRHLQATPGHPWGDRNMGVQFDKRDRIYALALQAGNRWIFAQRDELSAVEAVAAPSTPSTASRSTATSNSAAPRLPAIAFDGLAARLFEVPSNLAPPANLRGLQTDGKRLFFIDSERGPRGTLKTIALEQTAGPADVHTAEVSEFQLSANGKKLLIVKRADGPAAMPELQIMDAAAKPPASPAELARTAVRLADWQLKQSPSDEWRQIFGDAWRMHRDYFYDPSMHGVDWLAMRAKFEPLLARVTDRAELADLMGQLVAEVNALHSQVAPGDTRSGAENVAVGGLGAVFAATPSGLQVRKIYQTDTELPSERGPLAQLGVELLVGDTVAAINNQSTVGVDDAGELLRGQVGKQVLLGVQRGTSTFSRIVVPVSAARERELRLTDWEISRRQAVEAASANKYGYLHLRAMGEGDVGTFAREFYPVYDRDGLIIDVRGNGGGSVDSILIEKLMRRAWMFWQAREGGGYWNMQHAFRGHIVVITDEDTYSNGETFAEGFKRLGLGTVIGRRTAGAGVWLTDRNRQVDGGITRAAEFATYSLDDTWLIEGVGSKPDIEVDNPPRATFDGQDAQLDAAIAHLRKQLAAKPVPQVKQPPYRKL